MSTALACLRVDWNTSHKINGSYAVFVDYSNTSSCLSSSGASYILVLEQPSYEYLVATSEQAGLVPSLTQVQMEKSVDNLTIVIIFLALAGFALMGFKHGSSFFK